MSAINQADAGYLILRDLDSTHDRRVRILAIVSSVLVALIGTIVFIAFLLDGRWINAAIESPIMLTGMASLLLIRRGQVRTASLVMIFSLFVIFFVIALFGDIPTADIPRTTHLALIPIAFGSYIALKRESAWLRHGFSLLCLSAVALFASTTLVIDVGLILPETPHRIINWVISVWSMGILYVLLYIYVQDVSTMENYLHLANNRFVSLVSKMFPKPIAERLLSNQRTFAERHDHCTILFADIVGFTSITERMSPEDLITMLSEVFHRFDLAVEQSGLTKIKTIGDAYMVAAGVPTSDANHAIRMIQFAQHMLEVVREFKDIELRIGIASGELIAGVIGESRQVYDVWGDIVNLASRIESIGSPNQIQVSQETYELAKNSFDFIERPGLTIKGKAGIHSVYVLAG